MACDPREIFTPLVPACILNPHRPHQSEPPLADTTLRPRSGTEIIDAAFSLLKREYTRLITIMGIGYLPYLIALMLFTRMIEKDSMLGIFSSLFSMVISMFWLTVVNAAVIVAASDSYMGREVDIERSLRQTMSQFGTIVVAGFLKWLAIVVGIFFLLFGSVWAWVTFFAVPATSVIEKVDAIDGMKRSAELSRGSKMSLFGTLFITYLIYFMLLSVVSIPAALIPENMMLSQVLPAIMNVLVYPMVALVETLLYYDMRIRKEGYDIQLMTQELDGPAGQPAV